MSNVSYPSRIIVKDWIEILKNENTELKLRLPRTNELWFDRVLSNIELAHIAYCDDEVFVKGAHLFYYLDKDHNFVDGNKRSTIVITYLFFLINGYFISKPEHIRLLAKKVAKSVGSKHKDRWMEKIEKELRRITMSIK